MKKNFFGDLVRIYNSASLILRIFIGIVLGAVLGMFLPKFSWIGIFGDLFVGALKAIAPVLVFALVSSSLINGKAKLDRRFGMVIFLYMISTLLASFVAVAVSFFFPQTIALVQPVDVASSAPAGIGLDSRYSLLSVIVIRR